MAANNGDMIPSTRAHSGAARFWLAVLLTGIGTGIAAAALTRLLEMVRHVMWNGPGANLSEAAEHAGAWRHILVLLGAGLVTGAGQIILKHLSSGNGIDTTAAIWFHAGRMPALRTLGSWADRNRPQGWRRLAAPWSGLGLLGVVSIRLPQLRGNGKEIPQLAFTNQVAPALLLILLVLKPAATVLCMRTGAPGGLFTPPLTVGALLGGVLGHAWSWLWPGIPPGLFAVLGAAAVLAATTQSNVSTVVLMMELTGRDRSFILPLLLVVATAALVARTIEPRSIHARLTDEEVEARQRFCGRPTATGEAGVRIEGL